MNAPSVSRSALASKPWFAAFVALAIGLLAGLLVPQSAAERERLGPLAARIGLRLRSGLRSFADRAISEGLGRR